MVEDAYSTFTSSGGEERESTESQYSQSDDSEAEEKDSDVDYGEFSSGPESIQDPKEAKEREKENEFEEEDEEGGDTDDSDEEEDEIRGSADLEDEEEEEEDESRGSEDTEDDEEEFRGSEDWEDEDEDESGDIDLDAVTIIYTRHKRGFPLFREYMQDEQEFPIYCSFPEEKPDPYPWMMIQRLKALMGISPNDRAINYLLPLFKGWSLTHEDHIPRVCLCGEFEHIFSNFIKKVGRQRKSVHVSVGNMCGCAHFFKPGLAEAADAALAYLRSHAVYVAYVRSAQSDRHRFEILPTDEPHPLFENKEVIDYLKSIHTYFFVDKCGSRCYIEAKLENSLSVLALDVGGRFDAQLKPNVYCRHYGSGINLKIDFFGRVD